MEMRFINTCDRFRKTPEGEAAWQEMMATRQEITEAEFLEACDVTPILDEGETWEQYKETAQSDPIRYYKSPNGLYHFQTAGFEYIWGEEEEEEDPRKSCPVCQYGAPGRHTHETFDDLFPPRPTGFERGW